MKARVASAKRLERVARRPCGHATRAGGMKVRGSFLPVPGGQAGHYLAARLAITWRPNRYAESLYLIVKNFLPGQAVNRHSKALRKPPRSLENRRTSRPRQRPLKRRDRRVIKPAGNILCWGCNDVTWPHCKTWVKLSNCHDNFSRAASTCVVRAALSLYIHTFFSEQSKKNDNLTQKPLKPACLLGLRLGHACSPA